MTNSLTNPIVNLLRQMQELLEQLSNQQFTHPVDLLSGATLGQHTRHILEFYFELINQYDAGTVNYDWRKRDRVLESDRSFAINRLQYIINHINREDKALRITGDYGIKDQEAFTISTNYYRELVYNLEHTVHHMAFIRIGVTAVSFIELPADFGVAISTIQYRNTCAQ